jgi:hypothetical protein
MSRGREAIHPPLENGGFLARFCNGVNTPLVGGANGDGFDFDLGAARQIGDGDG